MGRFFVLSPWPNRAFNRTAGTVAVLNQLLPAAAD